MSADAATAPCACRSNLHHPSCPAHPPHQGQAMTDNLRQRLTTALAWMGPDYRQAVEDVLAVLEEDA